MLLVEEAEREDGVKFDFVIATRPDLRIMSHLGPWCQVLPAHNKTHVFVSDWLIVAPRHAASTFTAASMDYWNCSRAITANNPAEWMYPILARYGAPPANSGKHRQDLCLGIGHHTRWDKHIQQCLELNHQQQRPVCITGSGIINVSSGRPMGTDVVPIVASPKRENSSGSNAAGAAKKLGGIAPSARTVPRCYCFAMCNHHQAREFLTDYVPSVVEREDDPWYRYLQAVYGDDILLPFDMSRMRLFYHNDEVWKHAHPDVEWPMASCLDKTPKHLPFVMSAGSERFTTHLEPQCKPSVCDSWRRRRPLLEPTAHTLAVNASKFLIVQLPNTDHTTRGTLYFSGASSFLVADHAWLKVTRVYGFAGCSEGNQGRGC